MVGLLGRLVLAVFASLLGLGGVIGFLKANSRASLIAGLSSASVAIGFLIWSFWSPGPAIRCGAILGGLMWGVFTTRYYKSSKFMPAGLLALISFVVMLGLGELGRRIGD